MSAASGLFCIPHAAALDGLKVRITIPLIIIRALASLLVIHALCDYLRNSMVARGGTAVVDRLLQGGNKKR
jgi:hypothetical protein